MSHACSPTGGDWLLLIMFYDWPGFSEVTVKYWLLSVMCFFLLSESLLSSLSGSEEDQRSKTTDLQSNISMTTEIFSSSVSFYLNLLLWSL